MIIVLSDKKSNFEESFTGILRRCGAGIINDAQISETDGAVTVISLHKPLNISLSKGAVVLDRKIKNFKNQRLPSGITGICNENNTDGLELFKKSGVPIITCGMGGKNTLTVSSNEQDSLMLCLQRSITDINGNSVEPCEIKVIKQNYNDCYGYLAAAAVSLLYGIKKSPYFIL